MKKLELACFTIESVAIAQKAGVDRVELCVDNAVGGTTPPEAMLQQARQIFNSDLYSMIRPRGGDFVYSMQEIWEMQLQILVAKENGVNGLVFGVLTSNNKIDVAVNKALVALADPLPCTFHRAFDIVENPETALEDIIACGFTTVLTSGCPTNVTNGKEALQKLVSQAKNRIEIMPGGSLRSENIMEINQVVHASWYHTSAITDSSAIANLEEVIALQKVLSKLS